MTDVHDVSYYLKCMMGGILACGVTHTAICPLDVVKCRMQVEKGLYKSLGEGLSTMRREYGFSGKGGLFTGWGATALGYSMQGFGKFGFYEIFKDVYKGIVGEENAVKYKRVGWSIASGCAELIADLLLCPLEAIKVRTQTSKHGQFPYKLAEAARTIHSAQGWDGFYKGIVPLWSRQIPYTIVKFVAFEQIVELFYAKIFTKGKNNYTKGQQLSVTFLSGYIAGVFCAIVSHPADTMVSKINAKSLPGSFMQNAGVIYKEIGFGGLWAGLGTRIFMIGTLTGLQWWIYDSFKTAVGLAASGGGNTAPVQKH